MQTSIVEIGEELTGGSLPFVKNQIRRLIAGGQRRQVVDLSSVCVIDYGGLAALLAALRMVREAGGSLSLIAGSAAVNELLEASALSRVFKVFTNRDAALDQLHVAA